MLRQIAKVRALQKSAAEAAAMRASAVARAKAEIQEEKNKERDATAGAWQESVTAESFHPQITPLWAQKLLVDDREARHARSEAEHATKALEQSAGRWQAALKRAERADESLDQGINYRRHKREEAALQDAADAHLHRRRTP